jgi:putative sigma-54 modulation protein
MNIAVTFRHVDPTPALRTYAEEKLERVVKKYLRRPVDAHVILEVSKERHVAEITLQADHVRLFAKEETHDLYSAIDLAIDKIEHQAQKLKTKREDHKGLTGVRTFPEREVMTTVLAPGGKDSGRPEVIRTQRIPAKPMAVDDAVAQLAGTHDEFLVFTNARTGMLAVLYRRNDGHFGLIEPEA